MISKITGSLVDVYSDRMVISAGPFEYDVMVPAYLPEQYDLWVSSVDYVISLFTLQYVDQPQHSSIAVPRLIGFEDMESRDFFKQFCSVDGVGFKTALRAMVHPAASIAELIERGDVKALTELPGIGPATADRIVAKLGAIAV